MKRRTLIVISLLMNAFLFTEIDKQKSITINVWVHGTHPFKKIMEMKYSPLRPRMYVPQGLSLAKELPKHYLGGQIVEMCHIHDDVQYHKEHFYVYGWQSNIVSDRFRAQEGKRLFAALENLLKKYRNKYEKVFLRLIGFSHGGNVVLNMVNNLPYSFGKIAIELILIATPVQEVSREFVNNSHIKKAYSFYSDEDWIQRTDLQWLHDTNKERPFFSKRTFHDSDNVIQVNFKANGSSIGHLQFCSYLPHWSKIMKLVDEQIVNNLKKMHLYINYCTK